jgi:thiamine biosynthesis lipoprotein ApbE
VAPEVFDVLEAYEKWSDRSHGAYSGQLGELIATWKSAEKAKTPPTAASLQPVLAQLSRPGWALNRAAGTVTRREGVALNVDSFGKGYILSKAATAAQAVAAGVSGGMLNIGGDIFAWGSRSATGAVPWRVAVADPRNPADNFRPLLRVAVSGRAVSTSAGYARGYRFGKSFYSHILDPRTGFPATNAASATVIAPDSGTANALATTLCVLRPEEGLALVKETPGAECLIVMRDGKQWKSSGFAALEVARTIARPGEAKPALWPAGYEMAVDVTLKAPGGNAKRPYLVLWIEDDGGRPVRTVTLWGNKAKYFQGPHRLVAFREG